MCLTGFGPCRRRQRDQHARCVSDACCNARAGSSARFREREDMGSSGMGMQGLMLSTSHQLKSRNVAVVIGYQTRLVGDLPVSELFQDMGNRDNDHIKRVLDMNNHGNPVRRSEVGELSGVKASCPATFGSLRSRWLLGGPNFRFATDTLNNHWLVSY